MGNPRNGAELLQEIVGSQVEMEDYDKVDFAYSLHYHDLFEQKCQSVGQLAKLNAVASAHNEFIQHFNYHIQHTFKSLF